MEDVNGISTDDNAEEVEVRVEDDTTGQGNTESGGDREETLKNEVSNQEGGDTKRTAGAVIAELGNEKKQIAEKLVTLAKTNEDARQQVKEMLIKDPSTANYLKRKFGTDYDLIIGDEEITTDKVDLEKIREQERVKAQAEAIKAQMQSHHNKMLDEKAKSCGFTTEEYELYKAKVEILGGDEQAIQDAALIVNQVKATAKTGDYIPSEGEATKPTKVLTITPGLNEFSKDRHLNQGQFASEIARVKSLHKMGSDGKAAMELPGL